MKNALPILMLILTAMTAVAHADNRPVTPTDLATIESLQRTVQQREFARNGNPYALAKARAWLDLALDEYHDQDRSGIVQDATAEAATILHQLETRPEFDAPATPHPASSEPVRADLWEQVAAMKQHADFACASRKTAELEVQLVWTGHEKWESGWSHAEPYARIAENLAAEARQALDACAAKHAPAPLPEAHPPVERIVVEKRTLATDALFAFNRDGVEYLVMGGRKKLDALAVELKTWNALERIRLVGHTDHLGSDRYNQKLSRHRAEAIKRYLVSHGIRAELIDTTGQGEAQPIVQCRVQRSPRGLIECLQPNRRVELTIEGVRK